MEAYIKRFSNFRTLDKVLQVLSYDIVTDSLENEPSTIVIAGEPLSHANNGDWLIFDGSIYRIDEISPKKHQTTVKLSLPIEAFSRLLELGEQAVEQTVGAFVETALVSNWVNCPDPAYAIPYLVVSNSDTTPYAPPELDNMGCFRLSEYCRLMRKSSNVTLEFSFSGSHLMCQVSGKEASSAQQVSFDDGRNQLKSAAFSAGGLAKLTVLCDVDTGKKDENGDKITIRNRSEWYLSGSGEVAQDVPAARASGEWGTILIREDDDPLVKVTEAFAKKQKSHKLEFWSTMDLPVNGPCEFFVSGMSLVSRISYKRKSSSDGRFFYKSGELATTATEKLRGA